MEFLPMFRRACSDSHQLFGRMHLSMERSAVVLKGWCPAHYEDFTTLTATKPFTLSLASKATIDVFKQGAIQAMLDSSPPGPKCPCSPIIAVCFPGSWRHNYTLCQPVAVMSISY